MPRSARLVRTVAVAVVVTFAAALGGCRNETAPPPPPPPPNVTVVEVVPKDTPIGIEFVGKTASSRRVEIRARVDGFLERRTYDEGTMVQEGDILFEMDPKPLAAELEATKAELSQRVARVQTAEANLNRIRPLVAKVVQAELNLGYCTIRAPVTGLSSFAVQQEGAYLGFGTDSLLTYVAQLDPMWVEFSVSENQILKLRDLEARGLVDAPEDNIEVEIVLADGTVYPHTGQITFADASLSEETGTFLMRAEIDNPDEHLRPGQFVRVNLNGAFRPDAIVVPQRAVQQGAKGSFVWVIDNGQAEFRPVTVSDWFKDDWFIDSGLVAGDHVVVDGAAKLQPGVPVTIVEPTDETKNAPDESQDE